MNFLEIIGLIFCGLFAVSFLITIINYLSTIGKKGIDSNEFKRLANSKGWKVVVPDADEVPEGISGLRADAGDFYVYHFTGDANAIQNAYNEIKKDFEYHAKQNGSLVNNLSFKHYWHYSIGDDKMYAAVTKLGNTIMCAKAHPSAKHTVKEFFKLAKY